MTFILVTYDCTVWGLNVSPSERYTRVFVTPQISRVTIRFNPLPLLSFSVDVWWIRSYCRLGGTSRQKRGVLWITVEGICSPDALPVAQPTATEHRRFKFNPLSPCIQLCCWWRRCGAVWCRVIGLGEAAVHGQHRLDQARAPAQPGQYSSTSISISITHHCHRHRHGDTESLHESKNKRRVEGAQRTTGMCTTWPLHRVLSGNECRCVQSKITTQSQVN